MPSKILKYNIFHFPNDLMKFVKSHNFLMLSLGLLYYGGGAIIVYSVVSAKFPWSLFIWLSSAFVSIFMVLEFPGLFYLDDLDSSDQVISLVIMGPINFLRAICLAIIFMNQIEKIYPYTYRKLWKTHPETWSLDDPWIKAIQRNREIGMNTLVGNIRRLFYAIGKVLWRIAKIKISRRAMLHLLYIALLTIIFLALGAAIWLGITGKL